MLPVAMRQPWVSSEIADHSLQFSTLTHGATEGNIHPGRVLFDASHHALGERQGAPAFRSPDQRRPPRPDRFDKCLELSPQWLSGLGLELAKIDSRRRTITVHANHQSVAPREINREILKRLEVAELPHLIGAHPAGGKISHGPIFKFHASVGNIN